MVFLYTLLLLAVVSSAWASSPAIKATAGTFQGAVLTAKNGKLYNAFRGIPFAKPPVGDLRFRAPVAASHIDGVYDATDFKPYCIQINIIPNEFNLGQEDCLYLNVFTSRHADRDDGDLKKVFVFFHGGGNTNGFPNIFLPGTLVTQHDVIVVTVAYRIGYLGLLSTLSPGCEGNLHLKDQLLSLLWVKENIIYFGGDPDGVTIGGESAGAFDTSLLSIASNSRDLFTRAYCQSGTTGVKNSMLITNPRPEAIKLSRRLGCLKSDQIDPVTESEFDHMVNCLRRVPALSFSLNGSASDIPYLQPVLYGDLFPKDIGELFSDEEYLNSIKFLDRDYLIGLDHNEGDMFNLMHELVLAELPEEVRSTVTPQVLFYNFIQKFLEPMFGPVSQEVVQKVGGYYENSHEFNPTADFAADALFHISSLQFAAAATAGRSAKNSRVYLFRFVHLPEWMLKPYRGMLHGFDLAYLFDIELEIVLKILPLKVDVNKWNQQDELMRSKFITMIADFIKTGNPGRTLNSDLPSDWPGYDTDQKQYLELDLEPEVKTNLLPERFQLWSHQIPEWIKEFPLTKDPHQEL
uniref:Carboxylic ester hydrolase n=3 Tax=Arion vulgaris TaxID=1028688 RepID=A0A0B7BI03_9EUPU